MNKPSRIVLISGALALAVVVMALLGGASRNRGPLQQYKAELRARGEKLTFAELTRGRQTNAVDSHALITNATAKLSGGRLYPGLLDVRRYVGPGQASVTWRQPSPTWMRSSGSSSGGTWEEFAAQMQEAQSTLQEIRQALKEPAADAGPCTNMLVGRRVNFVAIRTAAQWLMGAAENELRQGRLEEGLQDLEALAALARIEREEYTLVAQMIRVAVAGVGLGVTWEALQAPDWTEPQLERLRKAWEPVDLVEAVEKGFVGDRAGGYELFTIARRSSGPRTGRLFRAGYNVGSSSSPATFENIMMDYLYLPAHKLTSISDDELFYLRTMQESIAALRLVKAHRPWPEARQAVLKAGARLNTISSSPRKFRYCFSRMSIPNYMRASERAVNVETERQMTLATIAIKRFQLRHGKLPPSLDVLVPEFLPAAPYDYMSAKPLGYHLKADWSYVLYSAGQDGKDDGGDPNPSPGTPPGLWEGRDAVWPSVTFPTAPPTPGTSDSGALLPRRRDRYGAHSARI
jgi:type II secretory pathway pseudopilin PulG